MTDVHTADCAVCGAVFVQPATGRPRERCRRPECRTVELALAALDSHLDQVLARATPRARSAIRRRMFQQLASAPRERDHRGRFVRT